MSFIYGFTNLNVNLWIWSFKNVTLKTAICKISSVTHTGIKELVIYSKLFHHYFKALMCEVDKTTSTWDSSEITKTLPTWAEFVFMLDLIAHIKCFPCFQSININRNSTQGGGGNSDGGGGNVAANFVGMRAEWTVRAFGLQCTPAWKWLDITSQPDHHNKCWQCFWEVWVLELRFFSFNVTLWQSCVYALVRSRQKKNNNTWLGWGKDHVLAYNYAALLPQTQLEKILLKLSSSFTHKYPKVPKNHTWVKVMISC